MERLTWNDGDLKCRNEDCEISEEYCPNCTYDCGPVIDAVKKLKEYEDLEEQGRLIELPCKIGDIVYFKAREIIKCKVRGFEFIGDYAVILIAYAGENDLLELWKTSTPFSDIGKTLFLTKEEAEKALAEMG